jgi:hypothetical protein
LKRLKHLIWKRRNESAGLQTFFHLKAPQKLSFWRGALPYTSSGSAGAPPYTVWERYKALWPLCRSAPTLRSTGAPLKPTRERYSALSALLRERYLF